MVIFVAGIALTRLPVALLPDVQYPTLVVWTAYPDVAPERVERAVTESVEEAVAGSSGLQRITSRSQLGGSLTRLDYGWNTDLDLATLEVREQLDRLGNSLPDEAERPVVLRLNPNDRPIMMIAVASAAPVADSVTSLIELKELSEEVLARRLEQLRDISRVRVTGGFDRVIEIKIDESLLAQHNLDINRISSAVQRTNITLPGGMIRRGPFRYAVEVSGEYKSVQEIGSTVVSRSGSLPIRLSDLAEIQEAVEDRNGLVRLNGKEVLLLLVERKPDSNTVRAAEEVRETIKRLREEHPDISIDIVVDESTFIRAAIRGVGQAILLGSILAVVVLLVFLRRPAALAAVAIAVPLSVAMCLIVFDSANVSFNLLSLSGLALGIGMLVDNAIIVVENIARLREAGIARVEAARTGTAEVATAITASTLTTIAVFLPLSFVEGLAGRLFRDQSLAVVVSLAASWLVALTAVPLIAARDTSSGSARSSFGGTLIGRYESVLAVALARPVRILAGAFVVVGIALVAGTFLHREVVPATDQGRHLLHLTMSPDTDVELLRSRVESFEDELIRDSHLDNVLSDIGERSNSELDLDPRPPYEAGITVTYPAGEADIESLNIQQPGDVQVESRRVRTQLESLLQLDEADLFIDLISDRRSLLEPVAASLAERMSGRRELTNVSIPDETPVPAFRLRLKFDEIARFAADIRQIENHIEASARGVLISELRGVNDEIPIIVRSKDSRSIESILDQNIVTRNGLLPLRTFVELIPEQIPASLFRVDQSSVVRLQADVATDSDLTSAEEAIREVLQEIPGAIRSRVSGANESFVATMRSALWSLLFSIVLVYLILAAQFENLVQPLVILVTVPLAAAGVVLVLWLTGQTLNMMSLTGCVVLIGIVVNDAIVKVDFINQRRAEGAGMLDAIKMAGKDRVRPILMTTITTVLGLLPLAIGFGIGSELRSPLAIAIIGGLTLATALTLIIVPVVYRVLLR